MCRWDMWEKMCHCFCNSGERPCSFHVLGPASSTCARCSLQRQSPCMSGQTPSEHTHLVCLCVYSQMPSVWPQVSGSGQAPRTHPASEILFSCFSILLKTHGPSFHFLGSGSQPLPRTSGHRNTCSLVWGPWWAQTPWRMLSRAATKTVELHPSSFCLQDWDAFPPLHLPECLVTKGDLGV